MTAVLHDRRIVQPEEEAVLERFNRDYLGWIKTHGPEIGDKAMQGDLTAEAVILRYQAFCEWLTDWSLSALDASIRQWEQRRMN